MSPDTEKFHVSQLSGVLVTSRKVFGILFNIAVTAMQEQHITFAIQKQKQTNKQIINVKADDRGEYHKKKENRTFLPESSFVRVCVCVFRFRKIDRKTENDRGKMSFCVCMCVCVLFTERKRVKEK